ncbi:MAG TPA: hypothetical protein VN229_15675 [Terriglobales bacterium]|nr:hypothetical protein [Terriglobales bacterium]
MDDSPSEPTQTVDPQTANPTTSGADESAAEGQATATPTTEAPSTSSIPAASATASPAAGSERVQEFSFDPWAGGPQPPDLQPRLAEVAKITDPVLRQQVEANVRLKTQREISAFTDQQRAAKSQAKAIIDQGGDLGNVPAKLLLQIDIPGRRALQDYAVAHGNPKTDPVIYYRLKNQSLDDPAAFQALDLADYMAQLDSKDYGELQQLQMNSKSGQVPSDLSLQQVYKANTDRFLQQLDLAPANDNLAKDPQKEQQAALIRKAVDLHVAATEAATGKKMTPVDHDALLQQAAAPNVLTARSSKGTPAAMVGALAPAMGLGSGAAEVLGGGAGLAGEGALATAGPLALLVAGILAVTAKSTANPALDEYQSPITTELPISPSMPVPTVLDRSAAAAGGKGIDCKKERAACTQTCLDAKATKKDKTRELYYKSFEKCMKGCLPIGCGGNSTFQPKRSRKR